MVLLETHDRSQLFKPGELFVDFLISEIQTILRSTIPDLATKPWQVNTKVFRKYVYVY